MFRKINGYWDAESLGLKIADVPLGSIVSGKGKNARIVGYTGGSTFSSNGIRMLHPSMKKFTTIHNENPDQEIIINAINPKIAKRLAKEHWVDSDYRVIQHHHRSHEV